MSQAQLKELHEKRQTLAKDIRDMADRWNADPAKWTGEDEKKWEAVNADFEANQKKWDEVKAAIDKSVAFQARVDHVGKLTAEANPLIGRDGASLVGQPTAFGAPTEADKVLALQGWLIAGTSDPNAPVLSEQHFLAAKKCGVNLHNQNAGFDLRFPVRGAHCFHGWNGTPQPWNALSSEKGTAGGFTFSETFVDRLERAMLAFGGIMQAAEIITTATGEPMRWPTVNDTTNTGRMIGESGAATTATDPTFGQKVWYSFKFTSDEILCPFELLRDSALVAGLIPDLLGERLGRIQASKYTTGTGAGINPHGIVPASSLGTTAAGQTSIAFDELIDLEHSIDPARRSMNCGYMFHDNILLALKKLKNGNGDYLWKVGTEAGAPNTLNTYPYIISQEMQSSIATATKTVLFGQLSMFKIRRVGGVRLYRLVERARANDQDVFLAFAEGDSNLLNAGDNPVKHLLQA